MGPGRMFWAVRFDLGGFIREGGRGQRNGTLVVLVELEGYFGHLIIWES